MKERLVQYDEQYEIPSHEVVTPSSVPMVERAFRLLDLLSVTEEGLTLSDLARALVMSKSSLHGLLKTLEMRGVITQIEDRRFILGPHVYNLAQNYIQRAGLRHFALPAMDRLAGSTGETVCLGKIESKGVRIVECTVDGGEQSGFHIAARRGMLIPLLAGATGACVLSTWTVERRESYIHAHTLPRFTEHSLSDPQQFLARVETVEQVGFAIDQEEYLVGVNAVAASLHAASGTVVAVLWIIGFASRFQRETLKRAAEQLCNETLAISQALGARR
jgi:IclR family KDG regulon transcriptional repressor